MGKLDRFRATGGGGVKANKRLLYYIGQEESGQSFAQLFRRATKRQTVMSVCPSVWLWVGLFFAFQFAGMASVNPLSPPSLASPRPAPLHKRVSSSMSEKYPTTETAQNRKGGCAADKDRDGAPPFPNNGVSFSVDDFPCVMSRGRHKNGADGGAELPLQIKL